MTSHLGSENKTKIPIYELKNYKQKLVYKFSYDGKMYYFGLKNNVLWKVEDFQRKKGRWSQEDTRVEIKNRSAHYIKKGYLPLCAQISEKI